jgi:hypothetical protein
MVNQKRFPVHLGKQAQIGVGAISRVVPQTIDVHVFSGKTAHNTNRQ